MNNEVKTWEEKVSIPTYPIGKKEKNPMFLEKRVYQGSSGVVYPHAVIEKISDEKIDKEYSAVFLENEYLKIMILPELGGRVQMAFDKVKDRHFVYYNQVIKPALVGLTGPWISGGIEFNWPQHHRPSTFEPVDYTITENEDGSKTVWVNEVERMFRTKGMAGFTLYPGKAYLEIKGRLYNRTLFPQTFLWWANPAVKVNDDYQSVFPPDVYAVFDHGKRDVSYFPIAKGVYYKVDYAPGTDISRYKNIPVPTSYMAITSKYNFIGGYEHDTKAGLLHIANHHVSPGKKQWTWGNGAFGQAWDRNLTDEDGPYIELMTGVYTDNQPDFAWLQPFEEKTFTQYFMPYSEVGMVKNATKEAVVNIEFFNSIAIVKLYTTSAYKKLRVSLTDKGVELFTDIISCSPATPYIEEIPLPIEVDPVDTELQVLDMYTNKSLVNCKYETKIDLDIPPPARPAKSPKDVENTEQLYLTGLHLEQYRHATFVASDYYEEALRRDPLDARNNNALGLWYLRRGKFKKSEEFFRKAIKTLVQRNSNPYDGEPYYNLGLCLKMQQRNDEAFDAFYKSTWNDAWQHSAFLNLARIATLRSDYTEALELIEKSLVKNYNSHTARHAKVFILRKLGQNEKALLVIEESLQLDPFNFGCLFEKYLLLKSRNENEGLAVIKKLKKISREWEHNFIEYAFDYAHAGLYEDAIALLKVYSEGKDAVYAMVAYYLGWFAYQLNDTAASQAHYKKAALLSPDFVFPNRIEDVPVLQHAIQLNPSDAKAFYYLGNFWYDKRQYNDAIECWENAASLDNNFPTVYRNLSLAYYNKLNNPAKALEALEKAFSIDRSDARVLMELDQLYKKLNRPHEERLMLLEQYLPLVRSRDDLYLEMITLHNQLSNYKKAAELIATYTFHPWEGGEGKVVSQYMICCIELAKRSLINGEYANTLSLLHDAENYPVNLNEGKLLGAQENDIHYLRGVAYEYLNQREASQKSFLQATQGITEPVQAIFYNDPQPDKIFYQGLAWQKLGDQKKANEIFRRLISFGEEHYNDPISIDYFAVSLPDLLVFDSNLDTRNKIHCTYLQALGKLGLGKEYATESEQLFDKVLQMDNNHQGAAIHKAMLNSPIIHFV